MSRSMAGWVVLLAVAATARGEAPRMPAVEKLLTEADAVFVGKVTGFGPRLVKGDGVGRHVAKLRVESRIFGSPAADVDVQVVPDRGAVFEVGKRRLFFARAHPTLKNTFVVLTGWHAWEVINHPAYIRREGEARRVGKLLAAAPEMLESKDAGERSTAAALLLSRYRAPREASREEEAVPAAESRLLLEALRDADWSRVAGRPRWVAPDRVFLGLELTAKDGWPPPDDYEKIPAKAKEWLKANAGKHQVRRFVGTALRPAVEP